MKLPKDHQQTDAQNTMGDVLLLSNAKSGFFDILQNFDYSFVVFTPGWGKGNTTDRTIW